MIWQRNEICAKCATVHKTRENSVHNDLLEGTSRNLPFWETGNAIVSHTVRYICSTNRTVLKAYEET